MSKTTIIFFAAVMCFAPGNADPWLPTLISVDSQTQLVPIIEFHIKEVNSVPEQHVREVPFGVRWKNGTEMFSNAGEYILSVSSHNTKIMDIVNGSDIVCVRSEADSGNYTFLVKGKFLGYTKAKVNVRSAPFGCGHPETNPSAVENRDFEISVSVVRQPSVLVNSVTGIMAALVAFNYINMGVQLDLECIGKVLKRPIGPTIGFACQFLFMPLASYGISYLLLEDISLRLGLFTLGCSPGGSMSNFWTLLFHGDVNLSITMTFISTIAALAMMPLWIFTLGRNLFRDKQATIPYLNIAGSLVMLTIPLGIGLLIRQYSPRLKKFSEKIIKPVTLVCVVFGVFVGLYANKFVFQLFTWQVVLSGIGIAWGGYSFGALMAWIFKLDRSQIIAVSIETAFQNPAVAFVMLMISLPQPEADLSSVPVIAQLILTGMPMWALLIIFSIYKKCVKTKTVSQDLDVQENGKDYEPVSTDSSVNFNNGTLICTNGPKPKIVRSNRVLSQTK